MKKQILQANSCAKVKSKLSKRFKSQVKNKENIYPQQCDSLNIKIGQAQSHIKDIQNGIITLKKELNCNQLKETKTIMIKDKENQKYYKKNIKQQRQLGKSNNSKVLNQINQKCFSNSTTLKKSDFIKDFSKQNLKGLPKQKNQDTDYIKRKHDQMFNSVKTSELNLRSKKIQQIQENTEEHILSTYSERVSICENVSSDDQQFKICCDLSSDDDIYKSQTEFEPSFYNIVESIETKHQARQVKQSSDKQQSLFSRQCQYFQEFSDEDIQRGINIDTPQQKQKKSFINSLFNCF